MPCHPLIIYKKHHPPKYVSVVHLKKNQWFNCLKKVFENSVSIKELWFPVCLIRAKTAYTDALFHLFGQYWPVQSFLSERKQTDKLAITEKCNAKVSNCECSFFCFIELSHLTCLAALCALKSNQCLLSTEAGFVNSAVSTLLCHLFQDKLSWRNGLFNYTD